ncbi:MAG: heme exporter protein CcmB [Actinomycetota bacterium]
MKKLSWLLWKDGLIEVRTLERFATLALFATAVLLTLQFALPPESEARPKAAAGFLWATVVFASVLEFRRSFESERRDGTLDGLRASPVDPTVLFIAKALSSLIVIAVLIAALVPLTSLFFIEDMNGVPVAIGIAVLGAAGLIAWGTLFAAISGTTRAGEIVLPILLFPLVIPQTIATVGLLAHYLAGQRLEGVPTGFLLLGAFDVLSWGTSLLLFEYVLEE